MSEALLFILGIIAGFVAAFALDVVHTWRKDEAARRQMRAFLNLLQGEVQRRQAVLLRGRSNPDGIDWDDAVRTVKSEGDPEIQLGLSRLRSVFNAHTALVLNLSEAAAASVLEHYQAMEEDIRSNGAPIRVLPEARRKTRELLDSLEREIGSFASRGFLAWSAVWVVGKAKC